MGEVLILLAAAVAGTVVVMLTHGGPERLDELSRILVEMRQQANLATEAGLLELSRFLLSPVIVVSMIGLFSIPVPLVEEIFKTLAAGVVARWVRPRAGRAFLWGVAGGAGFATNRRMTAIARTMLAGRPNPLEPRRDRAIPRDRRDNPVPPANALPSTNPMKTYSCRSKQP